MLSQSSSRSFRPLSLVYAPLAGRGLCSSLLVLLTLGAVPGMSWAANCTNTVTTNVTSDLDDGTNGTLRYIIANAPTGSVICFASNVRNITLTAPILIGAKNLTIKGYGGVVAGSTNNGVTISGNNSFRVFKFTPSTARTYTLEGLTITKGKDNDGDNNGGGQFIMKSLMAP